MAKIKYKEIIKNKPLTEFGFREDSELVSSNDKDKRVRQTVFYG